MGFYLKIASNRKTENVQRKENKSSSLGIHGEEPIPILYFKVFPYVHASLFFVFFLNIESIYFIRLKGTPKTLTTGL